MSADPPRRRPVKAYRNHDFMSRREARTLRLMAEYLEPETRFEDFAISDTIVFMGSSRTLSHEIAAARLDEARAAGGDVAAAERALAMSRYYEDARALAHRLTVWSKGLSDKRRRFVVCTGGGPGIMEAANRGASEAKGINIGLNISIASEQHENPYITRPLAFEFHYFFMRKFWFVYLAKAVVIFPGGFGTLDEFFEIMTLVQTEKLNKPLPVLLYGSPFWDEVVDFGALVRHGVIEADDLALFHRADTVEAAFGWLVGQLGTHAIADPGGSI